MKASIIGRKPLSCDEKKYCLSRSSARPRGNSASGSLFLAARSTCSQLTYGTFLPSGVGLWLAVLSKMRWELEVGSLSFLSSAANGSRTAPAGGVETYSTKDAVMALNMFHIESLPLMAESTSVVSKNDMVTRSARARRMDHGIEPPRRMPESLPSPSLAKQAEAFFGSSFSNAFCTADCAAALRLRQHRVASLTKRRNSGGLRVDFAGSRVRNLFSSITRMRIF
mmetsp:Transcript_100812/g.289225  ORF Transcript_100812/g.289225 Transcript_100812/m.289225 type:complete len:225 (-) Transcript_100812:5004-5678(-)